MKLHRGTGGDGLLSNSPRSRQQNSDEFGGIASRDSSMCLRRTSRFVSVTLSAHRNFRRASVVPSDSAFRYRRADASGDIPPVHHAASPGKVSLGVSPAGTTIPPDPPCFIIHAPSSRNGNLPLVSSSFRCRNTRAVAGRRKVRKTGTTGISGLTGRNS